MKFVHLHTHTHYSLLDGLTRVDELVERTKELGMDAAAITDHGAMYGVVEFYQKAKKAGIKPIIGVEVYITENMHDKRPNVNGKNFYHLVLLAENNTGYKNLMKLVTAAHLEGFYYKPRIDRELLRQHSEGLIGLSGCLGGEIGRAILSNNDEKAKKLALEYQEIFGKGNFYLELQHHLHLEEQAILNKKLLEFSKELDIPLVATQDSHYPRSEDARAHDVLLAVQTGNQVDDKDRLTMRNDDFSFLAPEKMIENFKDIPEAIENTVKIAERCNVEIELGKTKLPEFPLPAGYDADGYLKKLAYEGLPKRYGADAGDVITTRLDFELEVIKKTGFASYFLIVHDFVNWAKKQGIIVGPGRGSAAGSLVSYLLNITNIDPLKYDLLFERFLNPERISMPDIDLDFDDARRDEVFDYVREKYGNDHFAQVITFGTMAARGGIRDAGRALGFSYDFCDRIAKLIPFNPNQNEKIGFLKKCLDDVEELRQLYSTNNDAKTVIDAGMRLEGVARHSSTHACAVVITPQPLTEYVPLQRDTGENNIVTQYEMHAIEDLGLLKMDFLGLSNLTIIGDALRLIEQNHGVKINIDEIPLDDNETFRLLREGRATGVFQLESSGMRRYLKELKPTVFEDIATMIALYRPGPIELIPEFIARKHGKKKIEYLHPKLEPVLRSTYGIMIFQEDLMAAARALAGFSLSEADILRKAVGKKIKKLLADQKDKLIQGCKANGVSENVAEKFWQLIEPFDRYGFNKCLTGDTEIVDATSGKIVKLEDIAEGRINVKKILSLDNDFKLKPAKVAKIFNNGAKMVYEVTTRSGRKIKATGNHPFLGTEDWVFLKDLKIKDKIAVPREINVTTGKKSDIPDFKLATLGYLLSEGNLCHPHGVYFYSTNKDELDDYIANLRKFKNTSPVLNTSKSAISVYSKRKDLKKLSELVSFVETLGLKHKNATQKFIPSFVFELPNEKVAVLISKMFQGDGCINLREKDPAIFYATSSEKLAYQLQHLLLRFGILSTIHKKSFKYRGGFKTGYTVNISRWDNIEKFINNFSEYFIGAKKKDCQRILENHPIINGSIEKWAARGSPDTIPVNLIRDILRKSIIAANYNYKGFASTIGLSERLFLNDKRKIGYLRETVQRMAEFLDNEQISNISHSDVYWDEIKEIQPVGYEKTYDLEIESSHNFVANNFIVHNSHAICYAMIGYQTAYLKAHYPVEFMAALMNSASADIERVAFLIEECQSMGIEVLPPEINESMENFAVVNSADKPKIRFGLAAIKNVGVNIVQAIIDERRNGGPFKDVENFVCRVQNKDLNKKSLESLVRCGALDVFGERAALLANIGQLLYYSRESQKARTTGQVSLFGGPNSTITLPPLRLAETASATRAEKLMWEKELLGLFISDHPLRDYQQKLDFEKGLVKIKDLPVNGSNIQVKIGGIVTKIQKVLTKTGKPMIFSWVEDTTSKIEVVAFPNILEANPEAFKENNVLVIRGKLSDRDGIPKLMCDEVRAIATVS